MAMTINDWCRQIFEWAQGCGWWAKYATKRELAKLHDRVYRAYDLSPDEIASKLMLATSELAEALEEVRKPDVDLVNSYIVDGKPEGFGIEIADCVIRLMDLAYAMGIDLQACIEMKMRYNETRPYKHGGKTI